MATFETDEASNDSVQPEPKQLIDNLIEPYIVKYYREAECYPGLSFKQGGRDMVQINVPASHVPILLEAKPSVATKNDPYSGKNRPTIKGHAEEIRGYVVDRAKARKPWILGTLTANVSRDKIAIIDFGKGVCLVVIPKGVSLDITDGQHRTRAIQELRQGSERTLISDDSFPITLVLEDNFRQCQTDFRDMAQTKPISKAQLVSFGDLGRDEITQKLVERVPMFQGKTQKIKPSPGSGTKFIYTSNYIARAVSWTFANDPGNELLDRDVEESAEVLIQCLNQFFSECSDSKYIFEKKVEELIFEEVSAFKENCLLGVSVGLEILGRLLYCTYDKQSNSFNEVMVSKLAKLDWSRKSRLWENNVVRLDLDRESKKDSASVNPYKITASTSAVATAVEVVKSQLGWK